MKAADVRVVLDAMVGGSGPQEGALAILRRECRHDGERENEWEMSEYCAGCGKPFYLEVKA